MYYFALQPGFVLAAILAGVEPAPSTKIGVSRDPIDIEWDAFLAETPGADIVQTSMWAQLKTTLGWSVVRIVAREAGRIVGGAQMLVRKLGPRLRIGYIARGPTFTSPSPRSVSALTAALQDEARSAGLQCIIVQPASEAAIAPALCDCGFRPVQLGAVLRATTVIELSKSLDEILIRMKRKTRRNVRQSGHSGLQIRRGSEEDLDAFYELSAATADRKGFMEYPKSYFKDMWKIFGPAGHLQLFIAEKDGRAVSATLRTAFGGSVVCKKRGWSGEFGDLRPNEAVEWAGIQWAKQAGYRYYDFEGIPLSIAESIMRGERHSRDEVQSTASYKLGFGGEVRILPTPLVYIFNPLIRWGHRLVYPAIADWSIIDRIANRIKVN
jgi:lipid II:glycine glycyltransferase (peptidoglycan interpeptide bridge formation enzyme)